MIQPSGQPGPELRTDVRFDSHLPIRIEGGRGASHNISTHGIYFETDAGAEIGSLVNFTVEFTLYGRRQRVLCEGKVVRVDRRGNRIGVAARLLAPFFDEEALPGEPEVAAASA